MIHLNHVKNELFEALDAVVDAPLKEVGFQRKQGSLIYTRNLKDAEQRITFTIDYFPTYQPGAEGHIHPLLQVRMPQVSRRALALVNGDDMLLAGAPDVIVSQPIDLTAPKDRHQRWFASGNEEFIAACSSINAFLSRWVVPFLSEISTPVELTKIYEANDPRIIKPRHWHVFVAAAYLLLEQPTKARDVVRKHFGRPGLKARYLPLFASLALIDE